MMIALLLAQALTAYPGEDDAAQRASRARTQALTRAAASDVARRDRGDDTAQAEYRAAHARYVHAMAAWRQRVAACDNGDVEACR